MRLLKTWRGLVLALMAEFLFFGGPHHPRAAFQASLDAAFSAQAEVTNDWLAMDGVVGTAVGVGPGGEAVLKVYLTSPGAAAALPATFAGVAVSTEVTGPFVALGELPVAALDGDAVDPKRGFPRPVPIGVSTGHPDISAGTIGARVTGGGQVFALSNNHVYANNNDGREGDNLLQPGVADGGQDPDDALGTLYDFEPIGYCKFGSCPLNTIDAALALTSMDDLSNETPEGGYGSPRSQTMDAKLNLAVQKYGRTTGHTHGKVTGINATIDVNYRVGKARFENQIMITGAGFSTGGDSGSLIVSEGVLFGDRRPVGLLFAGSATNTIANPIDLVLDRFGVVVDGGGG